jgi:hypothetical protein
MKLPEYEPSESVWQKIEAKLNHDSFREAINTLPEYEPGEKVWTNISSQLNKTKYSKLKWAAAACVIMAFGIYFSIQNREVTFTKQEIVTNISPTNIRTNQFGYEEIKKLCTEDKEICEKPEFKALKSELDELHTASLELKTAIGKYNTEPELVIQLAEIENQKSDIISKMTAQI